jgi:hypothetical protein
MVASAERRRRARAPSPAAAALLAALAISGAVLGGVSASRARAGETSRDDLLEEIDLAGSGRGADDRAAVRELCEQFLRRFPEDEEAPEVRYALGRALAASGDDAGAARELEQVTASAHLAAKARAEASGLVAECAIRLGEPGRARAALEAFLAQVAPDGADARAARGELKDLAKIGEPATGLPIALSGTAVAVAFVKRGERPPAGLPPNARLIEVSGWGDPALARWYVPALPWVYVIDGGGVVRAAGVRGAAIGAVLGRTRAAGTSPGERGSGASGDGGAGSGSDRSPATPTARPGVEPPAR